MNHMKETISPLLLTLKSLLPAGLHGDCVAIFHKKNTLLFETGQPPEWMYFVVSGEVTLERLNAHGDSLILQRTRHGFVSEASLQTSHYHCDARVVSDSQIIRLPIRQLAQALAKDPAFASRWISMLNQEIKRIRLQCERLGMHSITDRLFHLIKTEGQASQYPVVSGLKSLAGELGVTHEALYRTLTRLEKEGLIGREGGNLTLRETPIS